MKEKDRKNPNEITERFRLSREKKVRCLSEVDSQFSMQVAAASSYYVDG